MKYDPKPIDVSDIELDRSLRELMEKLAENTHEIWAYERKKDGWACGPQRDDKLKLSPCMVPYEDLPESEKKYDRNTAASVIKTLIKLGYQIMPPRGKKESGPNQSGWAGFISRMETLSINEMFKLWKTHDPSVWSDNPERFLAFGKRSLKLGEPLFAYDIFSKGIECFEQMALSGNLDQDQSLIYLGIRQQQALSMAQSGALHQARDSLQKLIGQGYDDGETSGILGRVYKDLYLAEDDPQKQSLHLARCFDIYHDAFQNALKRRQLEDAYYNGINAATISLLMNDVQKSAHIAGTVKDICIEIHEKETSDSFWLSATLGEAFLLLKDVPQATRWYAAAGEKAQKDYRALSSMRKQIRMINAHQKTAHRIDECLNVPTVVVFTGHMIDSPGRTEKRFPCELEENVRKQIREQLEKMNAGIGFASAACGSDIIFLEEMIRRGGEINIFLPFEPQMFIKESVDHATADWKQRFENVLKQAVTVQVLGHYNPGVNHFNYEFTNMCLLGTGRFRAQSLNTDLIGFAVWDPDAKALPGGTTCAVSRFVRQNLAVRIINLPELRGNQDRTVKTAPGDPFPDDTAVKINKATHHLYLPLMFADVRGYSKLSETQLVDFSVSFLKIVSDVINRYGDHIISKRTQGDSLFIVFKNLETAVALAKELNKTVNQTDWATFNLPREMAFRISLDAGPCCSYVESVTNTTEFCGNYVNRAARMEPSTPPGTIYASQTFMALSMANHLTKARFEYAGLIRLPKNHGIIPAYVVR